MWKKFRKSIYLIGAGLGSVLSMCWWAADTKVARKYRLKKFLEYDGSEFDLGKTLLPYVPQKNLVHDLHLATICEGGGVKILWAPSGAGKSTTAKKEILMLRKEEQISGLAILKPPDKNAPHPADWFRDHLRDMRGPILKINEYVSDLLPAKDYREKPKFVFLFDQMENTSFDSDLKLFMKTLGEDCVACKTYVVIVICADATKAATMWDWNGREKISMLNPLDDFICYRWGEKEVEEWLKLNFRTTNNAPSGKVADLRRLGVTAGSPSYLVNSLSIVDDDKSYNWSDQIRKLQHRANFCDEMWRIGVEFLENEKTGNIYKRKQHNE